MTPPRTEPEPMPNGSLAFTVLCRRLAKDFRWHRRSSVYGAHCGACFAPWPCDHATDAAALTALAELLERVEQAALRDDYVEYEYDDLCVDACNALAAGYHPTPEPEPQG